MPFYLDIVTSSNVLGMIGGIGPIELIIALAILLLVLGPSKLPKLGAAIGKSYGNLKKGIREGKEEDEANQAEEAVEGVEVKVEVQAPGALEAHPAESDGADSSEDSEASEKASDVSGDDNAESADAQSDVASSGAGETEKEAPKADVSG